MTPHGPPELWLGDGDYGVIYRRGEFVGPGVCVGDCDEDGFVVVNELVTGVNIALGIVPVSACAAFDRDDDNGVSVDELVAAVANALKGCGDGE
jgi:hypothetical protein